MILDCRKVISRAYFKFVWILFHSNCYSNRSSPIGEEPPTQFTPEMEAVMRRRAERLSSSSDCETYCYSSSSSDVGSPQMFDSSENEDSNDATVYYSPTAPSPPYMATQNNNTLKKGKFCLWARGFWKVLFSFFTFFSLLLLFLLLLVDKFSMIDVWVVIVNMVSSMW